MAGRAMAAHLDERAAAQLEKIAEADGRKSSQLVTIATRLLLDMSPAARRAVISLDGASLEGREFAIRLIGRATLKAKEKIVSSRVNAAYIAETNSSLDTEEAIDAKAAVAARQQHGFGQVVPDQGLSMMTPSCFIAWKRWIAGRLGKFPLPRGDGDGLDVLAALEQHVVGQFSKPVPDHPPISDRFQDHTNVDVTVFSGFSTRLAAEQH